MGCAEARSAPSEVEDPCRSLLCIVFDSLKFSRKNIKYLEPLYYFMNILLQQCKKKQESSKTIATELKKFKEIFPNLLQEKNIDETKFFNAFLALEKTFNSYYHGAVPDFDFKARCKTIEKISNSYLEHEETLNEFFLNEACEFWMKHFSQKTNTPFSGFYEIFSKTYMKIIEEDLMPLPEEKKNFLERIKENIKIMIKYDLDSNNDLTVAREGWNVFSFNTLWNYENRMKYIEKATFATEPILTSKKLSLTWIYKDGKTLPNNNQKNIVISEKGIESGSLEPCLKNPSQERIRFGRQKDNDFITDTDQSYSRRHGYITMKKLLDGNEIRDEFYITNTSTEFIYFTVEAEGYLLAKNLIVNLTDNKEFFVVEMVPEFRPIPGLFSVEPEYIESHRSQPKKEIIGDYIPYIEIEFLDNQERKRFTAKNDEENFTFTIGSGPHDTFRIYDKIDDEENIYESHCYIKYDAKHKAWFVQDKTIVQQGDEIAYKTNIKCKSHGQYDDVGDIKEFDMRGVKIMDGMKICILTSVLEAKLI